GQQIRDRLLARRALRHSRRSRQTRYRPARHDNRRRPAGWLPPSLESRVQNILSWVVRLRRLCPITTLSMELVKFDTQLLRHPEIEAKAQQPLRDAAAVNATRWALYERLQATGVPVETGSGGRTKWNRTQRGLPKTHWLDAACVGASTPEPLHVGGIVPLCIT